MMNDEKLKTEPVFDNKGRLIGQRLIDFKFPLPGGKSLKYPTQRNVKMMDHDDDDIGFVDQLNSEFKEQGKHLHTFKVIFDKLEQLEKRVTELEQKMNVVSSSVSDSR